MVFRPDDIASAAVVEWDAIVGVEVEVACSGSVVPIPVVVTEDELTDVLEE